MKSILMLLCLMVTTLAQATTVRCYFPGYSEAFKEVAAISYLPSINEIKFVTGGKEYRVPVNACIVEEDL